MKIDRLIGIITLLLQKDKITAPELAARFEVSRRTINRDIEDICKAGIPLITMQGYGGGISITEGYKIDKTLFTQDELQTIFAGLKGMDSVSRTSNSKQLLDKFSAKNSSIVTDDYIVIDLASFYQTSLIEKIEIIKKAMSFCHIISFKYYYGKGENERRIEPYRLVFKWSSWYVFGWCLDRKDYRLFKLNRLWDLQDTGEIFSLREIPEVKLNFDYHFTQKEFHLKAIFAESEKYRLIDEYGINFYKAIDSNYLLLECDFVSYENMKEWVLSFGDKIDVIEPVGLREDIINQAKKILDRAHIHDI